MAVPQGFVAEGDAREGWSFSINGRPISEAEGRRYLQEQQQLDRQATQLLGELGLNARATTGDAAGLARRVKQMIMAGESPESARAMVAQAQGRPGYDTTRRGGGDRGPGSAPPVMRVSGEMGGDLPGAAPPVEVDTGAMVAAWQPEAAGMDNAALLQRYTPAQLASLPREVLRTFSNEDLLKIASASPSASEFLLGFDQERQDMFPAEVMAPLRGALPSGTVESSAVTSPYTSGGVTYTPRTAAGGEGRSSITGPDVGATNNGVVKADVFQPPARPSDAPPVQTVAGPAPAGTPGSAPGSAPPVQRTGVQRPSQAYDPMADFVGLATAGGRDYTANPRTRPGAAPPVQVMGDSRRRLSGVGSSQVSPWDGIISKHAGDLAGDPEFLAVVASIIQAESSGNPQAVGDNGSSAGLFQMHERGAGSGMTLEQRMDPDTAAAKMVPQYAAAYRQAKAQGLSGPQLAITVGGQVQRPAAGNERHYGTAYSQIKGGGWSGGGNAAPNLVDGTGDADSGVGGPFTPTGPTTPTGGTPAPGDRYRQVTLPDGRVITEVLKKYADGEAWEPVGSPANPPRPAGVPNITINSNPAVDPSRAAAYDAAAANNMARAQSGLYDAQALKILAEIEALQKKAKEGDLQAAAELAMKKEQFEVQQRSTDAGRAQQQAQFEATLADNAAQRAQQQGQFDTTSSGYDANGAPTLNREVSEAESERRNIDTLANRANQAAQIALKRGDQVEAQRQFDIVADLNDRKFVLDEEIQRGRLGLDSELGRGRLGIDRERLGLDRTKQEWEMARDPFSATAKAAMLRGAPSDAPPVEYRDTDSTGRYEVLGDAPPVQVGGNEMMDYRDPGRRTGYVERGGFTGGSDAPPVQSVNGKGEAPMSGGWGDAPPVEMAETKNPVLDLFKNSRVVSEPGSMDFKLTPAGRVKSAPSDAPPVRRVTQGPSPYEGMIGSLKTTFEGGKLGGVKSPLPFMSAQAKSRLAPSERGIYRAELLSRGANPDDIEAEESKLSATGSAPRVTTRTIGRRF